MLARPEESAAEDSAAEESRTDAAARARRDRGLRALTALYGGLGEDILPGVEPRLDVDAFVDGPWPIGWVSG